MAESHLGGKIRRLRRQGRLTQVELARHLGVSASYLNLIEHNRRPAPAELLVKLGQVMPIDLRTLSSHHDERVFGELLEVVGDPVFATSRLSPTEVQELAAAHPAVADAVLRLYEVYKQTRELLHGIAASVSEQHAFSAAPTTRFPSEEVGDLLQQHRNYFPELEAGASALIDELGLNDGDAMFGALSNYLRRVHRLEVRIERASEMGWALRRFEPRAKRLLLSDALRSSSRTFQIAHQIALRTQRHAIDAIAADPLLTSEESKSLCRVALANYFAGAVMMPYERFLESARRERYDIERLSDRFRTSFEQTCHRVTTLGRPGAEGIPFHLARVDIAGNLSKRFSASSWRFARFSGGCPRWNVFEAFLTPGMIRTQVSQMPDGHVFFDIARTVSRQSGGFHSPYSRYAIMIGCEVVHARQLVYADGRDLANPGTMVPIGPTCRLCDRLECEQRAFPSIQQPLRVDEDTRGVSFYAPPAPRR